MNPSPVAAPRSPRSWNPRRMQDRVAQRLEAQGRYPRAVLFVALSGLFATTFPITVLTLALPTMAADFGTDEAALAWVITLPVVASALALPILGKLGDLYGHRRMFVAGFTLAVVFTALSATATNPAVLIVWRTLTQVAGASTAPSSLALINRVHHGPARAKAMGWWSMIAAGAPVVGLTIGAPVIDAIGWPMLFVLQAVLMVAPVLASWLVLRETPRQDVRFDVAGAATLALGIGPLLLMVNEAQGWGLLDPRTLACLAATVIGLGSFWAVERRSSAPLVPLSFLRARATSSILVVAMLTSASYMGAFFLASLLLVNQFGYSLTSAVPILAIRPVIFAGVSPVGGWATSRLGPRMATILGCASLAGGLAGLALGSAIDSLWVVVVVGFFLQGTGYGLLRPAISTALANSVEEHDLGMAGAAERLTGQIGVGFGITIMAALYASNVDRFPVAFGVGAVLAFVAALTATGMAGQEPAPPEAARRSRPRRAASTERTPSGAIRQISETD